MKEIIITERQFRSKRIFHSEIGGHVLTPFFGTRQRNEEGRGCQVENGDGVQRKGIGHGLVPIRRLSVYGQVLIRGGLGLEGGIFIY